MQTRTTQRLRALCCNIRPRLWHEVMIVCIQLSLPLPILYNSWHCVDIENTFSLLYIFGNTLLFSTSGGSQHTTIGLVCIVLLVIWFCMLVKKKWLKNKAKFVCTQMGHTLIILVVLLIGNTACFYPENDYYLVVFSAIRIIAPISFGVYILISIPSLQRRVTTAKAKVFATNRHTNPPSTRVSLPTDTAEHAPNFLSPSTAEPSEVTPLIN